MASWHNEQTDKLVDILIKVQNREEAYKLLDDLCTIKEVVDMAQRLEVARLIKEGKNYQEINGLTGVSTATISRVNKCLTYGNGGYEWALSQK